MRMLMRLGTDGIVMDVRLELWEGRKAVLGQMA